MYSALPHVSQLSLALASSSSCFLFSKQAERGTAQEIPSRNNGRAHLQQIFLPLLAKITRAVSGAQQAHSLRDEKKPRVCLGNVLDYSSLDTSSKRPLCFALRFAGVSGAAVAREACNFPPSCQSRKHVCVCRSA